MQYEITVLLQDAVWLNITLLRHTAFPWLSKHVAVMTKINMLKAVFNPQLKSPYRCWHLPTLTPLHAHYQIACQLRNTFNDLWLLLVWITETLPHHLIQYAINASEPGAEKTPDEIISVSPAELISCYQEASYEEKNTFIFNGMDRPPSGWFKEVAHPKQTIYTWLMRHHVLHGFLSNSG